MGQRGAEEGYDREKGDDGEGFTEVPAIIKEKNKLVSRGEKYFTETELRWPKTKLKNRISIDKLNFPSSPTRITYSKNIKKIISYLKRILISTLKTKPKKLSTSIWFRIK